MQKTRIEQDEEIRMYFQPYASPKCKECLGTAKAGWLEYLGDMRVSQYKICFCVENNIRKIQEEKEVVN